MVRLKILPCVLLTTMLSAADAGTWIQQVAGYDFGGDPTALRALEAETLRATGQPAQARDLEKRLIAALPSARNNAARDSFCRNLAIVGSSASVPALAALLNRADTLEMARYALERIPGPEATGALRKALPQTGGAGKAGLAVSLGRRRDAASVPLLRPLLASSDRPLTEAAATALAHIGTPAAREALLSAKATPVVADALLQLAETAPATAAGPIYRNLLTSDNEAVRMAALHGIARVEGARSTETLLAALKTATPRVRAIAIRELARLDEAALIRAASTVLAPARVQILTALADTGHATVAPLLEESLASESVPVRIAAINGLAKLGTRKQIPTLAARAGQTTGEEQAAVRLALASIRGADVDAAILEAIPVTTEAKTQAELIRASGERGIRGAPAILLRTAASKEKPVRTESIRALRETAGPPEVPQLIALLSRTEDDTERSEYERTVAAAIRRSKDASVAELLKANAAATDADLRVSLLAIMSAVGNNDALPVIREALKAKDNDQQRAAINALAGWPSADPAPDLLALAQSTANASHQALALRGFVRLVQIPSSRPPAESAKMLADGLAAARRPEEKKIILAAAQRIICPESLALVKSQINDPAVGEEARQAATALERSLSFRRN
ncbi:MAG: HEAT repeat domain-containing protein [Bryobacteraceae bacterium]|nr:HEAT repeat domain-containing protein [Bryobacteraceae bacterium]